MYGRTWKRTWCCYMKRDETAYLKHILDAISQIEEYVDRVSWSDSDELN